MASMIKINQTTFLDTWFDRKDRLWWGRYIDLCGDQIGDAWFDNTRDGVLVFRPHF